MGRKCRRTGEGAAWFALVGSLGRHPLHGSTWGVLFPPACATESLAIPTLPSSKAYALTLTHTLTAGAAGLVVGQPFDVVKVRYQTPAYHGKYSSIHQAFREYL